MKRFVKRFTAAMAILTIAGTAAVAQQASDPSDHKFEKAAEIYAKCNAATASDFEKIKDEIKAFTDAEIMAETVNDPEKFFALMDVVNDPHTIHVMASCATEPVMWDTWMRNGTDFNKMSSAMVKMMNPAGMMKWMMAPVNPEIWKSILAHMDPEKYTKWTLAMVNPEFYSPATAMLDPKWYDSRIKWMSNPDNFAPLVDMFSSLWQEPAKQETAEKEKPAQ